MWRALFTDRGGPLRVLEKPEQVREVVALNRGSLWLDLQNPTGDEIGLLGLFGLDPLAVEDIVTEVHHPKVDDYGDYIYLAVHGAIPGARIGEMSTCELDAVLGPHWLVTHGPPTMRSVSETWNRAIKANSLPGGSTVETLQSILATQATHHVDEVERLQAELSAVEAEMLRAGPKRQPPAHKIYLIKGDLSRLRLILGAQREVVHRLGRGDFRTIPARLHMHFRDVYDDLYRATEMTDLLRDMSHSALQTHLSLSANRTNEIVKVLTILSCFILPLTLITGWFGMNFKHLSALDWRYGEEFVLGLFGAVTLLLAYFMRRKGWF
jgi:magnesium transporter